MLVGVLDARDPVLRREAGESTLLARAVARRLDLSSHELEVIATAALLRDVGNVAIPERILLTPGPLSPDELTLVEMHPRVGAALIDELPALHDVATAVRYHHERLDGTGYPTGLGGDAIPIAARVLAVVDAYSAMTHERPHRPARWPLEALAELTFGAGSRFDARVVRALADEIQSSTAPHPELAGAVASAIDTAGLPPLRELTGTDPLTLLPGHRAFHEAAAQAVEAGAATVAVVQLEELEAINRRDGYAAGDRALLIAARATQLAAARVGGTVYRDSGRRLTHPRQRRAAVHDRRRRRAAHRVRHRPARPRRGRRPGTRRERRDAHHARPRRDPTGRRDRAITAHRQQGLTGSYASSSHSDRAINPRSWRERSSAPLTCRSRVRWACFGARTLTDDEPR